MPRNPITCSIASIQPYGMRAKALGSILDRMETGAIRNTTPDNFSYKSRRYKITTTWRKATNCLRWAAVENGFGVGRLKGCGINGFSDNCILRIERLHEPDGQSVASLAESTTLNCPCPFHLQALRQALNTKIAAPPFKNRCFSQHGRPVYASFFGATVTPPFKRLSIAET